MHVIVNPAPLLRYTYTSAPLTATSWGPPDNHIRVGWDRPGVHKVVAPDGCLRARGTTLVGSHAHEPRWRLLSYGQCGGPRGETSETRQLTPAGSQMPAAVSARKKWTPRTVSIAAGGLATLNAKACLAGEPPFTPTAGLVCPCTSGVYSMQFEFHERPEKYTGRGED